MKAAEDPGLAEAARRLEQPARPARLGTHAEHKKQAQELSKSLKDATVEYWIGVDDQLMYKAQFGASLDTSAQKDMQGVAGVTLKGAVTMAKFDEPVDVTAPADAKSFKELHEPAVRRHAGRQQRG